MKPALFYEEIGNHKVKCHLCPHHCILGQNETGKCLVRKNTKGNLISENFGLCSSIHFDPIEKKPLYHFYPGSHILSVGSVGCNLSCNYCQNCEISQTAVADYNGGQFLEPKEIIALASKYSKIIGVAFTYNEPTVCFEYMIEIARKSKGLGLKNVMVSNGYINPEPLQELLPYIDGFNIDLKAFRESFYKYVAKGNLEPVKETLKSINKAGKHLEVTNLLIPSQNDKMADFVKMIEWISDELGKDTVLHLSRYFPAYKSNIDKTSLKLMFDFCEKAKQNLHYVYLGNVTGSESQNTICSGCDKIVISRYGNFVQKNGVNLEGNCIHCNNKIVIS